MEGYQSFLNTVIVFAGIAYVIGQWRNGRNKKESDTLEQANATIDLLNKRADAFDKELIEAKKHIRDSEIQIAKLEEALKHKDLLLDQYLKIITNRNPELEETLKDVRNFLKALNEKIGDGQKVNVTK